MAVELQWKQPTSNIGCKPTDRSKFDVQKEEDLLKTAEDEGFVCSLNETDVLDFGMNEKDKKASYLGDIYFLDLSSKRCKDVSTLDLCQRLKVCNLSCNFLRTIEPLKWCRNLIYLDLHSNQIVRLPTKGFWESMRELQTLYAHDNGICRFEDVKHLAAAENLQNLTLFDTPLSLKKNYRHCVVNAVWTLNALDYYVVSDEEIIEDANFHVTKFKSRQPHFQFKPISIKDEMKKTVKRIHSEISMINSIQSRWCPVLILQRVIRGFLTRLRYEYLLDTRLWAAVSIQRFYRKYRVMCVPAVDRITMPLAQDALYQSLSSIKLNYDTYLRMRRSKHKSLLSVKSFNHYIVPSSSFEKSRHVNIDAEQLHGLEKLLEDEFEALDLSNQKKQKRQQTAPEKRSQNKQVASFTTVPSNGRRELEDMPVKDPTRLGQYFTQFKFLGEVTQRQLEDVTDDIGEEIGFRLTVQTPAQMKHGALEEMIIRTIEGADDIRAAAHIIDKAKKQSEKPPKLNTTHQTVTSEQRLFLKTHGSMGLACFRAVEQAYKDRAKVERLGASVSKVRALREKDRNVIEKRTRYRRRYRTEAAVQNQADRVIVQDAQEERQEHEQEERRQLQARRLLEQQHEKGLKNDYKFALEFCSQNASIGKALHDNDRYQANVDRVNRATDDVMNARDSSEHQHALIEKYMSHKKLLQQAESVAERVKLEGILADDAKLQRLKNLANVEHLRSKRLPVITSTPQVGYNESEGTLVGSKEERKIEKQISLLPVKDIPFPQ